MKFIFPPRWRLVPHQMGPFTVWTVTRDWMGPDLSFFAADRVTAEALLEMLNELRDIKRLGELERMRQMDEGKGGGE